MTTLIISDDEKEDIINIIKSLKDSVLLLKGVTETVQNEVKEQKVGFLTVIVYIMCEFIGKSFNWYWNK